MKEFRITSRYEGSYIEFPLWRNLHWNPVVDQTIDPVLDSNLERDRAWYLSTLYTVVATDFFKLFRSDEFWWILTINARSRSWLDSSITFDGDVLRRRFLNRWKAESQGFPSVQESASEDITMKSYGRIESTTKSDRSLAKSINSPNLKSWKISMSSTANSDFESTSQNPGFRIGPLRGRTPSAEKAEWK